MGNRWQQFKYNKNSSGRDSERELLYDDNIHVEASAYAH